MANTKIEWADKVGNPIAGCTKCSPGCLNCYAEKMAWRLRCMGKNPYYDAQRSKQIIRRTGWTGEVRCYKEKLDQPRHWRKASRIFVCSMSDLFHPKVPFEFICKILRVVEKCSQHTFLMLTKRPQIAYDFFGGTSGAGLSAPPLPNLHLGVSISNQVEADKKIPILLQIPAAVRWLSIEPMLEGIDLAGTDKSRMGKTGYLANYFMPFFCNHCGRHISKPPDCVISTCRYCGGHGEGHRKEKSIHGVVVGGESGPRARPMHPDWPRNLRDQCVAANVPFYFKQWGAWIDHSKTEVRPTKKNAKIVFPDGSTWPWSILSGKKYDIAAKSGGRTVVRVGKKKAGRVLDGKEWNQLPERK